MGVWGGKDPRQVDLEGIATTMREALERWMSGHIMIYDDDLASVSGYDGFADTGGEPTPALVLDSGANGCLIQAIRSPSRVEFGGQASAVVGVRFQLKRSAVASTVLRAGLRVVVVDGGNDDSLPAYQYQLLEAVDSSLAWDRIMEATITTTGA